ncbi:unnamed protein product [Thlaspi arvense]|uniref:FBD domain-containing protein n=1 Tax=Thlaspi arvense TaxID=13288 RepID=A0AAU9SH61_THLAR|nr:unnamed protein product [Thlaspi arvense]
MDMVPRDMISGLPDPLISLILSSLPTKKAAFTSILSKRWRFLFASVTNLDFAIDDDDETSTSFVEFVERVLALQGDAPLSRFSLNCVKRCPDPVRVTRWIQNVLGRGVSDLGLTLTECPLPPRIFVSKTLVRLKVGPGEDISFGVDVKDVFLPKLKTLDIDSVEFQDRDFGFVRLISGCPMLEELFMMNIAWANWTFCSVYAKTLKRLTFFCEDTDENPKSVSFDTPNLEYLEYSDSIAGKYPKVVFSSLVEAHIGLRLSDNQSAGANTFSDEEGYPPEDIEERAMVADATEFFKGICNVRILYLSAETLEVLTFCCKETPVFNNLVQLTIESNSEIGWDILLDLLMNCPNLETLVFKGLIHKRNNGCGNLCCCNPPEHPSCLSSSPVKVLKVIMSEIYEEEDPREIEQMKHFLETMPCLEQLIVYYNTSYDPAVFGLSKKLQKIDGIASPKCLIRVISQNLSLSSTVPCSLAMRWFTAPATEAYCSSPSDDEYSSSPATEANSSSPSDDEYSSSPATEAYSSSPSDDEYSSSPATEAYSSSPSDDEGLLHKATYSCGDVCLCQGIEKSPSSLTQCPVKFLTILNFEEACVSDDDVDMEMEMKKIKHFLKKMPNLEQLIIYYSTSIKDDLVQVSGQLQLLPEVASFKCKIQVISNSLGLSITLPISLSMKFEMIL